MARPRGLGIEADGQFQLFAAIERQEVDRVCIELGRMGGATKKAILLPKSKLTKFCFRTPLMAAAACADISIFTAVLDACRSIFASSNTLEVEIVSGGKRQRRAFVWSSWFDISSARSTPRAWLVVAFV